MWFVRIIDSTRSTRSRIIYRMTTMTAHLGPHRNDHPAPRGQLLHQCRRQLRGRGPHVYTVVGPPLGPALPPVPHHHGELAGLQEGALPVTQDVSPAGLHQLRDVVDTHDPAGDGGEVYGMVDLGQLIGVL